MNPAVTITVRNAAELRTALEEAACGSAIELAVGRYPGDYALHRVCPRTKPILVRAHQPGGAVLDGRFVLDGSALVITGVRLEGDPVASGRAGPVTEQDGDRGCAKACIVLKGHGNRATANWVVDSDGPAIRTLGSGHEVDHNDIDRSHSIGIEIQLDGNALQSQFNHVHHNHVRNQIGTGNGGEAIRLLTDTHRCASATIEWNRLDRVYVPGEGEGISIKSGCNLIRGNTLVNSPMTGISNRHGFQNRFEENWIEGGKGLVILGDHHTVRGNVVRDAPIRIHAGNGYQNTHDCPTESPAQWTRPTRKDCRGVHPAARIVTVEDNVATEIKVGLRYQNPRFPNNQPAEATTLVRNGYDNVCLCRGFAKDSTVVEERPRGIAARPLRADEVGPGAARGESACLSGELVPATAAAPTSSPDPRESIAAERLEPCACETP